MLLCAANDTAGELKLLSVEGDMDEGCEIG